MVTRSLFTPVPFERWKKPKLIFATCAITMNVAVSYHFQFMKSNSMDAFINIKAAMKISVLFYM